MSAFEDVCNGRPASLVRAALEFASDHYSDLDVDAYHRFLLDRKQEFLRRIDGPIEPEEILRRLNDYFFGDLEFTGNTENYYDPRNSFLNDVLDRRMGIPISLSILFRALAAAAGVRLDGINFPGHFLLAYTRSNRQRVYIDVFHCGQWLDWNDCKRKIQQTWGASFKAYEDDFEPMTDAAILQRMLRNLKGIYSRTDLKKCLQVQERLVQLSDDDPDETRDLGILYFHVGRPLQAMQVLERLVRDHPGERQTEVVNGYLDRAAQQVVLLN